MNETGTITARELAAELKEIAMNGFASNRRRAMGALAMLAALTALTAPAATQDKVKVGFFP
jgi:hypothetical protein